MKELVNAAAYLGSDIFQILQVLQGITGKFIQVANGSCQRLGRSLADITDPQTEYQPVQRLLFGCLDRRLQIADALFPKTFQLPDLVVGEMVETRNILQKAQVIELADVGVPKTS